MQGKRSHKKDGRKKSRRRRAVMLPMFALLLLLLLALTLNHRSLPGAYGSTAGAEAGDRAAGDLGDGRAVVDEASGAHGPRLGLGHGTSLDDPIVDEWVTLQPFRQGDPHTIGGGSNTGDGGDAGGDGLRSLLGPLPGGGAGFGPGGGGGGISDGGFAGGGFGSGGVGGGSGHGGGLPSGNPVLNPHNDQGGNGADGEDQGHGPDPGTAPGGSDRPGGSHVQPGNGGGGNGSGGSLGPDHGHAPGGPDSPGGSDVHPGNGGGFQFVPDSDVTGNPDDSGVSIILTDTPPNPPGGPNEGGYGSSDLPPQGPAPVPEPTGLVLLGSGLVLAGRTLRRRSTRG